MLVIGNGESRNNIDIDNLTGPKIGCNAIFRDYTVNHLVCVDRRMMNEALSASANETSLLYTRKDWYNNYKNFHKRIRTVPDLPYVGSERWDDPFNWGSGPYAILLGAKLSNDTVTLLGFDLFSKTNTVNNIYKGTNNYDAESKKAVDPRYWIHQIGKIFECYTKTNFVIYSEDNWQLPKVWNKPNVTVDNISNLV